MPILLPEGVEKKGKNNSKYEYEQCLFNNNIRKMFFRGTTDRKIASNYLVNYKGLKGKTGVLNIFNPPMELNFLTVSSKLRRNLNLSKRNLLQHSKVASRSV